MTCEHDCARDPVFPRPIFNRPGLDAIDYRIGDYIAMRAHMLAQIGADPALSGWTHRLPDDPGIALVEAAAIVADILAQYQQTYANEAIAQICAGTLGVDYRKVRVVHGRTERIDFGIGAHATRATVMTGSATHHAATMVRAKAIEVAAELLRCPTGSLDVVDGVVVQRGLQGAPSVSLGEVARALAPTAKTRGDREPGLSAMGWFHTEHMTYPYGAHLAIVSVDRGTGHVAIERFVVVYDIGRAINPMLVEGQIAGGVAQGIGGALLEEFRYDERGVPLAVTFADYLMPTATDVPPIDVLILEDAPSPRNPLGMKGAGEAGINGVGAAIASAIDDALGRPGAVTELPVTPQRLLEIMR